MRNLDSTHVRAHRIAVAGLVAVCATAPIKPAYSGELEALIVSCAPLVHPVTMGKLVRVESGGRPYAVLDSGPAKLSWKQRKRMLHSYNPGSLQAAVEVAQRLRDQGHLFDIGLTQINNRNLARYGVSIEQALDPCTNLRIGSQILTAFYLKAQQERPDPAQAVLAAISAYNTGNFLDGFSNGYVRRVVGAGQSAVPEIPTRYDAQLPASRIDATAGTPLDTSSVRLVRPPEMLSRKIVSVRVSME